MNGLSVSTVRVINLDNERHLIDANLLEALRQLIAKTYILPASVDIYERFLNQGSGTEVALFYGEYGNLAGFAAICIHQQTFNMKFYAIYQACSVFAPLYHDSSAATKFGLTHAMKYKLMHPEQRLVFVGEAPTPMAYRHYSKTVETYYPNPYQEIPPPIGEILESVRKRRGLTCHGHPLCVSSGQALAINPAIVDLEYQYEAELIQYYKKINPDYLQGVSLLVYIPLDLANISLGLKNAIHQPLEFSLT